MYFNHSLHPAQMCIIDRKIEKNICVWVGAGLFR